MKICAFTDFGSKGRGEFECRGQWGPAETVLGHNFSFVFAASFQAADDVGHAVGELLAWQSRKDHVVPFVPHAVVAVNRSAKHGIVVVLDLKNEKNIDVVHGLSSYLKKKKCSIHVSGFLRPLVLIASVHLVRQ